MINNDILADAQQEIYKRLCSNKLLVSTYSKSGIMRRIKKNIKAIRTNEEKEDCGGWCVLNKPEIVLCSPEKEKPPQIEYFTKNPSKREVLIHEAVHAILKHKSGTGLLHIDKNREPKAKKVLGSILGKKVPTNFAEIGRGINEGYTNWIVEKSNIRTNTYQVLKSINRQIEACIGEEEMIKFSRGKLDQFFRALNMEKTYGIEFLRQLDEVYYAEKSLRLINDIEYYLQTKIENLRKGDQKTEEDEERENEAKKVTSSKLYQEIFTEDIDKKLLALYLREKEGEDVTEERAKIYESLLSDVQARYKIPQTKALSILVGIIEEKIINSLVIGKIDSPSTIREFENIMGLMKEIKFSLDTYGSNSPAFTTLRQNIEKRSKKAFMDIYSEIEELMARGDLTGEMLEIEFDKICALIGDKNWRKTNRSTEFANWLSKKSKYPEENALLIKYALDTKTTDIIDKLSIQMTSSNKGIIFENGKIRDVIIKGKSIYNYDHDITLHKGEHFEDKLDWTLKFETDYSIIIRQFEKLKQQKLAQNPKLKIQITNGMIIFTDGKNYDFYDIVEGADPGIKPAELITRKPIKSMINKRHKVRNNSTIPVVAKNDFITKMKRKIHKIIGTLKEKPKEENKENIVPEENKTNAVEAFRETLRPNQGKDERHPNTKENETFDSKGKEK